MSTNRSPIGSLAWDTTSCGNQGLLFSDLCFNAQSPAQVVVTWPDGDSERFELSFMGNSFFASLASPVLTPLDRATSTLRVAGSNSATIIGGQVFEGSFGNGGFYDPSSSS